MRDIPSLIHSHRSDESVGFARPPVLESGSQGRAWSARPVESWSSSRPSQLGPVAVVRRTRLLGTVSWEMPDLPRLPNLYADQGYKPLSPHDFSLIKACDFFHSVRVPFRVVTAESN